MRTFIDLSPMKWKVGNALSTLDHQIGVPLPWRNLVHDKARLMRAAGGIGFAALLMIMQLGFRNAFLDSALDIIKSIDADIVITSATKFRFGHKDPFSRRQLYAAKAVAGVNTARPIYFDESIWRNPQTGKNFEIQVLAFDPDQPVFTTKEIDSQRQALKQPDTVLWDSRARRFQGFAEEGTISELARRRIRVVGTFLRGPDFTTDGTVVMSDRNFIKFTSDRVLDANELADIELGIVKIHDGYNVEAVKANLQRSLSPNVAVRTKAELIALETQFQNSVSPVGPIFYLGTGIGFLVGMMICYQILNTDVSDLLPQYATLKAMGYGNSYLIMAILQQAVLYAVFGFIPAYFVSVGAYLLIGEIALLPLKLTGSTVTTCVLLTLVMCIVSAFIASRALVLVDPAEVF
jgi:putative ABC transport system permease protein